MNFTFQISYGASHKYLSDKQIYPSFLRTIPSDSLQVKLMLQLLQRFNWTWIAIVGSDDAYGSQGLQDLYTLATGHGICVPYHGLIPYTLNRSDIKKMVAGIQNSRVKVIVVFALASYVNIFFEEVVDANITGCVWIGSEDWSADVQIAQIPNLHSIGSILGVSISEIQFPELLDFEISYVNSFKGKDTRYGCNQICQECRAFTLQDMSTPSPFSMSFAFNVYSAVYTIAYGLHELLHCKSGQCVKDIAYPWQLLEKVKKVNFTLYNQSVSFDSNGDPSTGYGIGMWSWNEDSPIFRIIGSYNKMTGILQLNGTLKWHTKDNSVPESFCSKPCDNGERRVQTGFYTCCFNCFSCPEMTFLNKSFHAFQIVCIFKMATHMPKVYDMWVKRNGSDIFIVVSSLGQVLICVIWIVLKQPSPIEDYGTFPEQIILKCSETTSVGFVAQIVYIGLLSMLCFAFCYMGKDLPDNYNEAKCISFSLLVYFFSWIAFFTTYIIYQGKYVAAVNVAAILVSVMGILIGYFTPKIYVILLRPELNTTEHFQTAIQNYTKKQSGQ
ncbi:taste receptor type 1 member 1-like [Engystomops pustulosus]|uniref:taste receptor type 1 member 1-like n=1 Tax=Engystomops pustulosus TaxID=76066 RepID=UPI003AFB4719